MQVGTNLTCMKLFICEAYVRSSLLQVFIIRQFILPDLEFSITDSSYPMSKAQKLHLSSRSYEWLNAPLSLLGYREKGKSQATMAAAETHSHTCHCDHFPKLYEIGSQDTKEGVFFILENILWEMPWKKILKGLKSLVKILHSKPTYLKRPFLCKSIFCNDHSFSRAWRNKSEKEVSHFESVYLQDYLSSFQSQVHLSVYVHTSSSLFSV